MDFSLYKDKRVFLTGHTGFKGGWMLAWLHGLGAIVRGFALTPINQFDLYNTINGDALCQSVIGDIRNGYLLEREIIDFQPDYIFHLAAQPLVRLSYEIPSETVVVNVIGTAHVLDAVRKLKKRCIVVLITTDKVYENREWDYSYRENDQLGGYDPYSSSKACAELVIASYRSSFFNPGCYNEHQKSIASARAGNVIGGGDWAQNRIIPDIIRALLKHEAIVVRNPHSVRPWQHVLEPIAGYLQLGLKMAADPIKYASSWNFGPMAEDNISVIQLAEIAVKIWGSGEINIVKLINEPHEASVLRLDIQKTISQLHWKPKLNSLQAIQQTISFYLNRNNASSYSMVKEQINNYNQI